MIVIKKIKFFSFLILLSFFPNDVFAWGSAAHAYIVKNICQVEPDALLIYGSIVPDFFNIEIDSTYYSYITKITHYNLEKVKNESRKKRMYSFALGYISHNERWGADLTAHKKARTIHKRKGYILEKEDVLKPLITLELGEYFRSKGFSNPFILANIISSSITHLLLEFAVDLKIKTSEDSSLGNDLVYSAINRDDSVSDMLVLAYGNSLSKRFKISKEEAISIIRGAEEDFRDFIVQYGVILGQDMDIAITQLSEEIAQFMNDYLDSDSSGRYFIEPQIIRRFIMYAINQVNDDYLKEISETIKYLKKFKEIKNLCKKCQINP
jgi:hypothetical protein